MDRDKKILNPELYQLKLNDREFNRLSGFISENFGIRILPVKRTMLQGRLYRRLRDLNMKSFREYIDYLFSKEGQALEVVRMMDEVSTNKTDFFREIVHFNFLKEKILPGLDPRVYRSRTFKAWSAGCSSGEEPYTLAMTLEEFYESNHWFTYQIKGTDISMKMLETARQGIYRAEKINPVPAALRSRYLLKGTDGSEGLYRVIPELRRKITFERLNFMSEHYPFSETFDLVFCRNVLIYFDYETQEKIIHKICNRMATQGILMLGHSESIARMNVPLKQILPTVFTKL